MITKFTKNDENDFIILNNEANAKTLGPNEQKTLLELFDKLQKALKEDIDADISFKVIDVLIGYLANKDNKNQEENLFLDRLVKKTSFSDEEFTKFNDLSRTVKWTSKEFQDLFEKLKKIVKANILDPDKANAEKNILFTQLSSKLFKGPEEDELLVALSNLKSASLMQLPAVIGQTTGFSSQDGSKFEDLSKIKNKNKDEQEQFIVLYDKLVAEVKKNIDSDVPNLGDEYLFSYLRRKTSKTQDENDLINKLLFKEQKIIELLEERKKNIKAAEGKILKDIKSKQQQVNPQAPSYALNPNEIANFNRIYNLNPADRTTIDKETFDILYDSLKKDVRVRINDEVMTNSDIMLLRVLLQSAANHTLHSTEESLLAQLELKSTVVNKPLLGTYLPPSINADPPFLGSYQLPSINLDPQAAIPIGLVPFMDIHLEEFNKLVEIDPSKLQTSEKVKLGVLYKRLKNEVLKNYINATNGISPIELALHKYMSNLALDNTDDKFIFDKLAYKKDLASSISMLAPSPPFTEENIEEFRGLIALNSLSNAQQSTFDDLYSKLKKDVEKTINNKGELTQAELLFYSYLYEIQFSKQDTPLSPEEKKFLESLTKKMESTNLMLNESQDSEYQRILKKSALDYGVDDFNMDEAMRKSIEDAGYALLTDEEAINEAIKKSIEDEIGRNKFRTHINLIEFHTLHEKILELFEKHKRMVVAGHKTSFKAEEIIALTKKIEDANAMQKPLELEVFELLKSAQQIKEEHFKQIRPEIQTYTNKLKEIRLKQQKSPQYITTKDTEEKELNEILLKEARKKSNAMLAKYIDVTKKISSLRDQISKLSAVSANAGIERNNMESFNKWENGTAISESERNMFETLGNQIQTEALAGIDSDDRLDVDVAFNMYLELKEEMGTISETEKGYLMLLREKQKRIDAKPDLNLGKPDFDIPEITEGLVERLKEESKIPKKVIPPYKKFKRRIEEEEVVDTSEFPGAKKNVVEFKGIKVSKKRLRPSGAALSSVNIKDTLERTYKDTIGVNDLASNNIFMRHKDDNIDIYESNLKLKRYREISGLPQMFPIRDDMDGFNISNDYNYVEFERIVRPTIMEEGIYTSF